VRGEHFGAVAAEEVVALGANSARVVDGVRDCGGDGGEVGMCGFGFFGVAPAAEAEEDGDGEENAENEAREEAGEDGGGAEGVGVGVRWGRCGGGW